MLRGGSTAPHRLARRLVVVLTSVAVVAVLTGLAVRQLTGPPRAGPPHAGAGSDPAARAAATSTARPRRLVVTGATVWALTSDDTVVEVDARSGRVVGAPIRVGFASWDLAVGKGALWVAANGGTTVARIDPRAHRVVAVIDLDMPVQLVAASPGAVWVISDVRNVVLRIDPASNRVTGRPIRVADEPTGAVVAFGSLWVASHDQGLVSRVDLRSGKVTEVADPWSIHFIAASAGCVWASHYHDGTVTRIDPLRNRVVGRPVALPFAPGALAAGPDAVWVLEASPDTPGGGTQLARLDPRSGAVAEVRHLTGLAALVYGDGTFWLGLVPGSVSRLASGGP